MLFLQALDPCRAGKAGYQGPASSVVETQPVPAPFLGRIASHVSLMKDFT